MDEITVNYFSNGKLKIKTFNTLDNALKFWYKHDCLCIEGWNYDIHGKFVYDIGGDVWIKVKN